MDVLDRLRLDVPVLQAGMGGGVAGPGLAAAVAAAGALGTLGLAAPDSLRAGIQRIREQAPGRPTAVNLLMPFVHRRHVEACVGERVDVAVLFFGGDASLVQTLQDAGTVVLSQVGTADEVAEVLRWGVDAIVAQGVEAGGHLLGREPALSFLPKALAASGSAPVFVAGGIATAADTRQSLDAGAAGVVAGTRFLLTHEARAHPAYQARVLAADHTVETTLFGLGWPARHRVVANAATGRWLRADGEVRRLPGLLNSMSGPIGRAVTDGIAARLPRAQRSWLPLLSPAPPVAGMPDDTVEHTPLYAGETAMRIEEVVSAADAVGLLAPA